MTRPSASPLKKSRFSTFASCQFELTFNAHRAVEGDVVRLENVDALVHRLGHKLDGLAFACDRRRLELQIAALDDSRVGWHPRSRLDLDDVADDQIFRADRRLVTVAYDVAVGRKHPL